MDSDLPLLEISGEDDSLIQQTPTLRNDAVKVTDAFFSASPLQLPISPINQSMKNNVAPKRPGYSSPRISNKENMDFNKAEGPRLTPHQMKRRKKVYNLRKSLAWDKAFFTEEGVLDPEELSMISGTYGNSLGEALSAISEEKTKSPYSSSKCTFASQNLQAFSASKNRNNGGLLLPQHNVLAADSKVTQEVHSYSGSSCNRSGVKSGRCPRPFPSSSPAHVHNTKSATKDSHLPKIPDHKSGPHSLLKASKSSMLGTSQLKHNQIAHPTVNTHKNISLESSCKNVKSTQNKEKSGPKSTQLPAKASGQPARENMANSSLEVNLLTNTQISQIRKPTRSSEANLKPVIPSSTVFSGEGLYRPKPVAGLPPRSTSNTVGNESQLQKVKPSGLRMPSPSLGYFAQNNTQPSNIPKCTVIGSRKSVRDFRAPHAPRNTEMDIPENSVTAGLCSSMQCSEVVSKAAMHKAIKSDLMVRNIKQGNIRLLPDKSSEPKRSKHAVHCDIDTEENIGRHEKHKNIKEIAYKSDTNVQITNDLKLLECGTCEKSQEDNHGRRVYTQCQDQKIDMKISLCKPENISTISDLRDEKLVNHNEISNIKKKTSTSSYNLEPQVHCLGVEQIFQCNPATYSEEFQGKEANAINEFVILKRNEVGESETSGSEVISAISLTRSQDGELDTNLMTEQPPLEAQSGSVEASLPVKIQDSSIGPHSRHEVESIENATSSNVGKPFLCEVSGSWVQYDQASLNEGDKSEAHSFRNDGIKVCVATDFCLDDTGEGKTVEASPIKCIDNIDKQSSVLRASIGSEADCSQHVSQFQNFKRIHEDGEVDLLTSKSHVKLSEQQHMNITETIEQFREESNLTCSDLVNGQVLNHTEICNSKSKSSTSSDNLELRSPCLEVEPNSQCNPTLYFEEFQGKEANASDELVIRENNKVHKSDSNGSKVILALSAARSQGGEFDMYQKTEQPDLQARFGVVEVSPAVEIEDCSIGTHSGHQIEAVENAASFSGGKHLLGVASGSLLQFDQASIYEGRSDAHSFSNDAIMEHIRNDSCLDGTDDENTVDASQIDYTGRIVEESSTSQASTGSEAKCFQHLSRFQNFEKTHEERSGVDILTNKSHAKTSHQQDMNITLTTEQFREESNLSDPCSMDSVEAYMKDKDASTSIREQPERGTKPNCTKIAQQDAVPFSNAVAGARKVAIFSRSQGGEFDMYQKTEQPDLQARFGVVEVSPAIEIEDCSIGTHSGHQIEAVENAASFSGGKHLLGVASGSLLQFDQASIYEGRSDAHSFSNDAIMEHIRNDSCLDGTDDENTVDASQIDYTGRIVEESSTSQASTGSEAKCFQHLSRFQNFEKTHEERSGVDILTNKSHAKTSHQQDMNITLTTEQFREESNLSDPCSMDSVEAYMKDKDASTSIREQPERGTKPNCTKIAQQDAVPFSNAVAGAREEHDDPFVELSESVNPFACDAKNVFYVETCSLGCDISKDASRNLGVSDLKDLYSSETEGNSNGFLYKSKHSEKESAASTIAHQLSTSSDLIEGLGDHSDNFHSKNKSCILLDALELQSPCFRVEQSYQCNPELYSKEFRGGEANASNQFVIQERSMDCKSEINGSEVISAPSPAQSLKAQFDLVEVSAEIDIQDCSTDLRFRSEVVPIDNATSLNVVKPFLCEVSGSLVPYDQASIHEGGECDDHGLKNNAIMECAAADSCLDGTAMGETVEVFQNENTGRIVEESSLLRASIGSEAKCFKHSEFANLEREHDDKNEVDSLSSKSHVKTSHWQHTNITATTEQFKEESYLSGLDTIFDQCSGDNAHAYMKDSDATSSIRKQSERCTKPNSLVIPPPDAVPFSDEWLAAIEAAGEDILTKKSGAVQNSPPDKSLPEPSPWSPVKRKTNEIGPFDCTKYTNTQPADL